MKIRITGIVCCLLAAACSPDLMDENSVLENNRQQAQMQVDVRVSGTMVSTRSDATAAERTVADYGIYVFDVTTGGLQYCEQGIVPAGAEAIEGTRDYRLGVHEIVLPSAGPKHLFVLANAGRGVTLPDLVTEEETAGETQATQVEAFRSAVVQNLAAGTVPSSPFVMSGTTYVASAADADVPVCLGRTVARISVRNGAADRIALAEVSVTGAPDRCYPFAASAPETATTDYPAFTRFESGAEALAIYLLPTQLSRPTVTVAGTLDGNPFTCLSTVEAVYADYDYKLDLKIRGGSVVAVLSPDFGSGAEIDPIEVSGEWLSDRNTVTLPFTPEPNYGFTIGYTLNIDGSAAIEKGAEDWYDAAIEKEGTIRIRTLKENTGGERTATFAIAVGGVNCNVKVVQQGLADVKTVKFGRLEWMDRSLGATLRASQAYANDIRSFGYLYQWGRTVPLPVQGEVEVVSTQMSPAEALASKAFISWTGETQDWNAQGVEGDFDTYWETVTPNPCPAGWRLPTYEELSDVMLWRNNALVFANGVQKAAELLPGGKSRNYVGGGSGSITGDAELMYHSGIKYKGTSDAYYIRLQWINKGGHPTSTPPSWTRTHEKDTQTYMADGESILRIDRLPADASADFPKIADARNFWKDHESDAGMETLVFPCGGRRDATGAVVESNNAAFYWSRSMFTGRGNEYSKTAATYASGLLYFRPSGRYVFMYAPAIGTAQVHADTEDLGYRNQAMQIRCVKEK